ncbi:MAG: UDP-N-acetylglucosamine--N-acetylmuramyl-(pentapeptide) pyrophosphoryl-undecaprenol N-acetylglucosamine transferase, partial [bacterium]|nr:UDP-N-acetylglucosamine--N-acetylmuramyl-(pentapeptide) pyrophosphoryl-undecaprenol N-acetylglucosamine transferase [bacterium]
CLWKIWKITPDVIFSKGGYGGLPAVLVGRLYFTPIMIHESDSVPGLANIISAKLAKKIAVSFSRTLKFFPPKKTALVGHPIRREILNYNQSEAKKEFGLSSQNPTILFIGGSQGAQPINEIILRLIEKLTQIAEIIHLCGNKNYEEFKKDIEIVWNRAVDKFPRYHLYPFMDEADYGKALAAADLAISRAGAGSIFEIAAAQKPSILIPLPGSASDHQKINAYEYAKTGACEVIEEANLTPNLFLNQIENLLKNPEKMRQMSERAKKFANLDAALIIAREIIDLSKI